MTDSISSNPIDLGASAATATARADVGKACANCGAPMLGAYCYACGQPEKGMIRHLASVLSDVADTVFNVDSRIFRSIVPLYLRPGFLTTEYFAGRRTRYVTPFRLFFFLCIVAFFAVQANFSGENIVKFDADEGIGAAQTPAEVQAQVEKTVAAFEQTRASLAPSSHASDKMERKIADIQRRAAERVDYLNARAAATHDGTAAPSDPDDRVWQFNGFTWDPIAHPIDIAWLPGFANAKLNAMALHAQANLKLARHDQRPLVAGLFSVLPQTLFVLMPLFAVLLKIVYIFKRRLYMEHLMVALHSHAFICLSVLISVLLSLALRWAGTDAAWAVPILEFLRAAAWIWIPIYLFLMQKRIYRQGWIMTTLKYWLVGTCYLVILSFGLVGALLAALALA